MDIALSGLLPAELADKVGRMVHEMNLAPCLECIEHRLVRIRAEGQFGWLISERENYYSVLSDISPYEYAGRRGKRASRRRGSHAEA